MTRFWKNLGLLTLSLLLVIGLLVVVGLVEALVGGGDVQDYDLLLLLSGIVFVIVVVPLAILLTLWQGFQKRHAARTQMPDSMVDQAPANQSQPIPRPVRYLWPFIVGLIGSYLLALTLPFFAGDSDYPIGLLIPFLAGALITMFALITRRWAFLLGLLLGGVAWLNF